MVGFWGGGYYYAAITYCNTAIITAMQPLTTDAQLLNSMGSTATQLLNCTTI